MIVNCNTCGKEFIRNGKSNRSAKCYSCRIGRPVITITIPVKLRNGIRQCNTMEVYDTPIFSYPDGTYDALRLTCKYSVETYVWNDKVQEWLLKRDQFHHALFPGLYDGPYDVIKALKDDYAYAIAGKGSIRHESIADELKDYDIDASYNEETHKVVFRSSRQDKQKEINDSAKFQP
jgi:hypothetical protein